MPFNNNRVVFCLYAALVSLAATGCSTTETSRVVETPHVAAASSVYSGARIPVSISRFDNKSPYMRGIFSDGVDRLGSQAGTILIAHLNETNRFGVLDRENLANAKQEAGYKNEAQKIKGARYMMAGDVTEFGRKEVGDHQLFGILGRGKEQIAYAKVTVNVIDPQTSEVVFSTQGAGEYALSNREIVGFGSTASYDSTLNGKVLDLAIRQAVDKLASAVDTGLLK